MSEIEIDPLRASESLVSRLPIDSAFRVSLEQRLALPVSRRLFLDMITASAHLNLLTTSALVAIRRKDDEALNAVLDKLLEALDANSAAVNLATAHLLMADEEGRVGEVEFGEA